VLLGRPHPDAAGDAGLRALQRRPGYVRAVVQGAGYSELALRAAGHPGVLVHRLDGGGRVARGARVEVDLLAVLGTAGEQGTGGGEDGREAAGVRVFQRLLRLLT